MLVICLSPLYKTRDTPNRVNREVPKRILGSMTDEEGSGGAELVRGGEGQIQGVKG